MVLAPKVLPERRDIWFRNLLIRKGISTAIYETMKTDQLVYIMGEGAHMKVHFDAPYIEKEFSNRVVTWPIAEDSGVNFALGASLLGVKPIFDVITADFLFRVMDSVCNTCATTTYIAGEQANPIIIRGEFLLFAPSTGQRLEAVFGHIPNLNVVVPSNQVDAYHLMLDALRRKEVTVFFEDRMVADASMKPVDKLDYAARRSPTKIGEAFVRKRGNKLTVVSYALTLQRTEEVLDEHPDWDVELIDLITIKPFDREKVLDSVLKTGKLLVVEPDIVTGGTGAEVVAAMVELVNELGRDIRVKRIGAPLRTIPASPSLHDLIIPNKGRIERAIRKMIGR
ncbi:MAG TPA: transketolase C-terminal domain-containing protein [Nitrososphaerales archaeon]|nr:transketolase C-terminal domain-containing protein [Nitrososphaerales archaeon]